MSLKWSVVFNILASYEYCLKLLGGLQRKEPGPIKTLWSNYCADNNYLHYQWINELSMSWLACSKCFLHLDCPIPWGIPRESQAMIIAAILRSLLGSDLVTWSASFTLTFLNVETGILKSVNHRLDMLGFCNLCSLLWWLRRKISRETSRYGQIQPYIFFYISFITCCN